jgi:excisionase family DNA binding protein
MPDRTYTTHDIARFCDVYPSSVVRWINEGKLKSYETPGGHQRVSRENLLAFLKEFRIPIPTEVESPQKRVLIVDDDVDTTRILERAFTRYPDLFKVEVCHSGVEALIHIGRGAPDLLIIDIVMPKMDGFQVCHVLKSEPQTSALKIIVVSGKKLPFSEKKLAEAGIDAFFRKPLDLADLLARGAELLRVSLAPALESK